MPTTKKTKIIRMDEDIYWKVFPVAKSVGMSVTSLTNLVMKSISEMQKSLMAEMMGTFFVGAMGTSENKKMLKTIGVEVRKGRLEKIVKKEGLKKPKS